MEVDISVESCSQLGRLLGCKGEINLFNDPQKTFGGKNNQAGSRKELLIWKWSSGHKKLIITYIKMRKKKKLDRICNA